MGDVEPPLPREALSGWALVSLPTLLLSLFVAALQSSPETRVWLWSVACVDVVVSLSLYVAWSKRCCQSATRFAGGVSCGGLCLLSVTLVFAVHAGPAPAAVSQWSWLYVVAEGVKGLSMLVCPRWGLRQSAVDETDTLLQPV